MQGNDCTSELTYCYYSNFQLFDEPQRDELLIQQRFVYKLKRVLGEEWKTHASNAVQVDSLPLNSDFVFDRLLVAWLQYLKINDMPNEDEGLREFEIGARHGLEDYALDEVYFKPVMDGFFFSAVATWLKLKQVDHSATRTSTPPKEQHQIKPLAMVTKKLMNYLIPQRNTLQSRMDRLSLSEDEEEETPETLTKPLNKLKKVTKLYDKIMQQQLVQTTYQYLGSLLNKSHNTYQVAQSFVMNIIEVKQTHLQQLSTSTRDLVKVRLLQPARGFYNDLMEAWILLRNQDTKQMHFKSFLNTVKEIQGQRWNDKYIGPTQFFFNTLAAEWKEINKKPCSTFQDEEQKFKEFFWNVKEQMRVYWEKEIVEKTIQMKQNMQRQ